MATAEEIARLREQNAAWIAQLDHERRPSVGTPSECRKIAYDSERRAKECNKSAPWRLWVYRCDLCGRFHVTNADKAWNQRRKGSGL